jgi:hypothetical protein
MEEDRLEVEPNHTKVYSEVGQATWTHLTASTSNSLREAPVTTRSRNPIRPHATAVRCDEQGS